MTLRNNSHSSKRCAVKAVGHLDSAGGDGRFMGALKFSVGSWRSRLSSGTRGSASEAVLTIFFIFYFIKAGWTLYGRLVLPEAEDSRVKISELFIFFWKESPSKVSVLANERHRTPPVSIFKSSSKLENPIF